MASPESVEVHSPFRMRAVLSVARYAVAGAFNISGLENLDLLDPSEPVVVATSHHTDVDIPFAAHSIAKHMDLALVDMSLSHIPFYDVVTHLGTILGGSSNFLSIDYVNQNKIQKPSLFNPANFEPMIQATKQGKRVVIAAYSPYKYRNPKVIRPGIGVPYLAAATNAKILPIEVIMRTNRSLALSETMVKTILVHPDFSVAIGEPFKLPTLDVSSLRHSEKSETCSGLKKTLREQGAAVTQILSSLRKVHQTV